MSTTIVILYKDMFNFIQTNIILWLFSISARDWRYESLEELFLNGVILVTLILVLVEYMLRIFVQKRIM